MEKLITMDQARRDLTRLILPAEVGVVTRVKGHNSIPSLGMKKDQVTTDLLPVPENHSTRPLKCNRKAAENNTTSCLINNDNYFPYHRFSLYLRAFSELERLHRLEAIVHGESNLPDITIMDDSILQEEFSLNYGGLDENSSCFYKLFRTYKESRLEEFQEWVEEEEKLKKVLHAGISMDQREKLLAEYISAEPDVDKEFTQQELKLFESVEAGPKFSGKEFFHLPRRMLSTDEIMQIRPKRSLNLAVFDPELSTFYFGPTPPTTAAAITRIVPPQASNRDDRGVSEKLALNIYEIISKFPMGILASEFMKEYERKYNYTPDYYGLGYKTFVDFLVDLNHVVFTQGGGPNSDFMMYPTYMENIICTPMDTAWRIYHKLVVILQLMFCEEGIAKTDHLVETFQQLYPDFQLPYASWGFENEDEFVVYLVENVKWRNDLYVVDKVKNLDGKGDSRGHCVVAVTKETRHGVLDDYNSDKRESAACNGNNGKHLTRRADGIHSTCNGKSRQPSGGIIPSQFVQMASKATMESDFLNENSEHECVVVYFYAPNDFEIVRVKSWITLNQYVKKWTALYNSLEEPNENRKEAHVYPHTLQPGLLLVIFNEESCECIRGQYVKPTDKPRLHRIHLIDEGGCITVHEDNLFYMYHSVLLDLKPLVIKASLWNVKSLLPNCKGNNNRTCRSTSTISWNDEILDYAYSIICPGGRNQKFNVKFNMFDTEERKWQVILKCKERSTMDVGHALVKFCQSLGSQACYKRNGKVVPPPQPQARKSAQNPEKTDFKNSNNNNYRCYRKIDPQLQTNCTTNNHNDNFNSKGRGKVNNNSNGKTSNNKNSVRAKNRNNGSSDDNWRSSVTTSSEASVESDPHTYYGRNNNKPGFYNNSRDHQQQQRRPRTCTEPSPSSNANGNWRSKAINIYNGYRSNGLGLESNSFPPTSDSFTNVLLMRKGNSCSNQNFYLGSNNKRFNNHMVTKPYFYSSSAHAK